MNPLNIFVSYVGALELYFICAVKQTNRIIINYQCC